MRSCRHGALALAAAFAGLILGAAPARAHTDLDTFGFGGRAPALGGAYTALASDYTATYYNPAGLVGTRDGSFGAGFSFADYGLEFDPDGGTASSDDTERIEDLSALSFGVTKTFGQPGTFANRVSLGIGIFLPTRKVVGATVTTAPGEPRFFMYGEQRDKIAILPAAAFKIYEGEDGHTLSIGAGLSALADIDGRFEINVFGNARPFVVEQELEYDAAPIVGLFWWPLPWLSFGAAYRGELSLKAQIETPIDLDGDPATAPDVQLDLEAITLFSPQQVQVGFAIDPLVPFDPTLDWLTISVDVTYVAWSDFDDPFLVVDAGGGAGSAQVDPDFDDIFIPRLGIEIAPIKYLAVRLGYFFQPTPVPDQDVTGANETNILDADKHVVSFGVGIYVWSERDEVETGENGEKTVKTVPYTPFSVDLFVQYHILESTRTDKAPNPEDGSFSPIVGTGYDVEGSILNVGVFMNFRF
ncbi:MAG: outer membrane protein transport protein [Actinobacteria bacterium]|nr:outer membrane protein transport protein [Actinomycetota bacterium]